MTGYMPTHSAQNEPELPPIPPGPAPRPPASNRRLFIGLITAGVVVIGGVVAAIVVATGSSSGSGKITVHGTMDITDFEGFTADDPNTDSSSSGVTGPCHAIGGYDDIAEGTEVVISDDGGKTLAIGHLDSGSFDANGSCAFSFTMTVPAGKKFYGVTVSHRGTVKFPEAEVTHAAVSLG
jgi:hypothetical protein